MDKKKWRHWKPSEPPSKGVGYLYSFQGCLLPYTNTGTVQEISEISCPGSDIPIQSSAFQSVHSTLGVHCNNKEVKLMAIHKLIGIHQYLDDWLVKARPHQVCLPTHSRTSENMPRTRLAGEFIKIRTGTKADLRFL